MKKIVSVLMAGALLAAAGISASAETVSTVPGSASAEITGNYVDLSTCPTVYSVDIEWKSLEFTYTKTGTMDWQPDSHTYVDNTQGEWSSSPKTFTVVNHSNAGVAVEFDFTPATGFETVSASYENNNTGLSNSFDLRPAIEGSSQGGADRTDCDLYLQGIPEHFENGATIGTVTVTLSGNE